MASSSTTLLLWVYCLFTTSIHAANQIKSLDDAILFRINWAGPDSSLLGSPDYEKLVMTSSTNEQYECLVPIKYGEKNEGSDSYSGPGPLSLILPLLQKQSCNLRLESYWTYELCHGQHIKQYREEREGKTTRNHEYILGEFSAEDLKTLQSRIKDGGDTPHDPSTIPTTKVEGLDMPYIMVNYTGGTVCDLTGRHRVSHILFVCYEEGRHDIYTIKETYTCEYEIVILSPLLCKHPAFKPREQPQTSLHCVPVEGSPKRPRNLLQIEAESLKLRSHGAILSGDTSSGSVKLEVVEDDDDHNDDDDDEAESGSGGVKKGPSSTSQQNRLRYPQRPQVDQKLVEDFLNGDYCLHGGSGWWKYEFCYGRKVEQYHEDRTSGRTSILLGQFSMHDHMSWLQQNPGKKPQILTKQHLYHFYSNGAICDVNGRPRQVEVKLKCKESDSPSSVTMYLLEPDTCEYILGVESQIVCWILPYVDKHGIYTADTHATKTIEQIAMEEMEKLILSAKTKHQTGTELPLMEGRGETQAIDYVDDDEEEEEVEEEEEGN